MIIKELSLRNFISYEQTTIQFPNGVTVIVGENGAGKTAILDAITYALCKKHGRDKDENLIRRRFKNASIRLKFSVRGKNYEVMWTLTRHKAASGYLKDLDEDIPLVRPGAGERTILPEITKIIGLSEDIFMNAIYVKQGEITRLIDLKPSERKKLMSQLLGIEALEEIWEAIKDPLKDLEKEREKLADQIEHLEQRRKELESKEEEISKKEKELEEKKSEKDRLESSLKSLDEQIKELEAKRKKYQELTEKSYSLRNEKTEKELRKRNLEEKIKELEEAGRKLKEYAPHYREKKLKEAELNSCRKEKEGLQKTLSEKLQKKEERKRLMREKQLLEEQIREKVDEIEKLIGRKVVDVLWLPEIHTQACDRLENELISVNKTINGKISEMQKYSILKALSIFIGVISATLLPVLLGINIISCTISPAIVLLAILIAKNLSNKQRLIQAEISSLQEIRELLTYRKSRLKEFNVNQILTWYSRVVQCEEKTKDLEAEISDIESLEKRIEFLNQRIKNLEEELKKLEPYFDEYVKAQGILEKENLKDLEELEKKIEQHKREKNMLDEELSEICTNLSWINEEIEKLDYRDEEYQRLKEEYEAVRGDKEMIEKEIGELEGIISILSIDVERLKEELKKLEDLKNACERLRSYCDSLSRLREFFSKDGSLQRAVRRKAALLIEEYARQLLQEFNLPFFDLKINEDFDVIVYGRDGEQTIETLSGGERVAIALVLRLSIAAALAGEALELMIMDEPTIHLDSERRRDLVNMLKNFKGGASMLAQLIVVSHDRELEEAADQIYEVVRSEGVSKIKQYTT
ncbi:MAG: AAA family ATPase [Sulfolobales archaeon]